MKNIGIALACVFCWINLTAQVPSWEKICGNNEENRPTMIKAFGNGVYVAGYRVIGGDEYATFSKYDINTGAISWEKYFELHTRITDFDYEPSTDHLFIVGCTLPFSSTVDNRSFLARISGDGTMLLHYRSYQQDGRERFDRIVRHPNPPSANAPFYILGIKNPTATPSSFEEVVLYNVDLTGTIVWGNQYSITPPDNEFSRGLIPYGNDLILVGNGTSNDGLLLRVSGANGTVVSAHNYPNVLDIYDGLDVGSGFLVLVGEDFSVNQAFAVILNLGFNVAGPAAGLRFTDIINFKDVWIDSFGNLYVIGENKNLPANPPPHYAKNYQVVHKLSSFIHAGLGTLAVDWARYLEDPAETQYGNGHISVTPTHNRIFYADARLNNPSGFGSWDMLIGSYDLDLMSACRQLFPINTTPFMPTRTNATATITPIPTPPSVTPPIIKDYIGNCNNFCSQTPPPCDCDFTWTNTTCYNGFFTVTCTPATPGVYTYQWDYDCNPSTPPVTSTATNTNATSFVQTFPYTFPCGGGTFTVCLKVTDPLGTVCNIMHTITVPSTCCGSATGTMACHPTDPYKYDFVINVTNPPGSTGCAYALSSPYTLTNVVSNPSLGIITGSIAIPDPIPTSAVFTLQTNCTCVTTGLPITCTQSVTVPTVCCKKIMVDDHTVCEGADTYDVPVYPSMWPPLNNVYQVTWYVQPKPATGVCPSSYWGGQPYQSTAVSGTLEPLHLYPSTLPGDLCVYAVVDLNDGPCTQIYSNIAMVSLCKPNACMLNDYEDCYTGTPVVPGPITLTFTGAQPACLSTLEWFDENGNPAPLGTPITVFQPTTGLSLPQGFTGCYMDFYYTAVLTDGCGPHVCKSRVRLYNGLASIGTLSMSPLEGQPFCRAEDATLKFTPNCAGEPPKWHWAEVDCNGNVLQHPEAGTMNGCFNTNELYNGVTYTVTATNGVCPPKTESLTIDVLSPPFISHFTAVADPCAEVFVTLSAGVLPSTVSCSGATFPCTYTYEWYKDGFLIGVTPGGGVSETFTYFNPNPLPSTLAGNYYVVIHDDCCPDNVITSWVEVIDPACEPTVMGPCFICDNGPVTLMAQMVLPPNKPCPTAGNCTFTWYDAIQVNGNWVMNNVIGTGPTLTVTTYGVYFLESNCNGCIKKIRFDLLGCTTQQQLMGRMECGVISVDELMPRDESPLRIYPNPTTGEITIEWTKQAPVNARVFITDQMGRQLRMLTVPDAALSLNASVEDLPPGLYFIRVQSAERLYHVAKLVKE